MSEEKKLATRIFEDFECLIGDVQGFIELHKENVIKCNQVNDFDGIIIATERCKGLERYKNKITEMLEEYDSIISEELDEASDAKGETDSDFIGMRNFTYADPLQIKLLGKVYDVKKSWKETLILVCEELIKKRPDKFKGFDKMDIFKGRTRVYFSYNPNELSHDNEQLSNGLYVELNLSANDKAKRCCDVVEQCGYSVNDIKFKVEWKETSQEVKKVEKGLGNSTEIKLPPKHSSVHISKALFEIIIDEIINYGIKNKTDFFNPRKISLAMNDVIISQSGYAVAYHVVNKLVNYLMDCKLVDKIEKGKYIVKDNKLLSDWIYNL